jgi:predicted nucleic acid-binding protein
MPQLLVRQLEQDVVDALRRRAAEHGRSAEAEHRILLGQALRPEAGPRFIDFLRSRPRGSRPAPSSRRPAPERRPLPQGTPIPGGHGYLLDLDALLELCDGDRADAEFRQWATRLPDGHVFTSAVVVGELQQGIEVARRQNASAAAGQEHWLLRLVERFPTRVLSADERVLRTWATLKLGPRVPTMSGLLVATALVHDLTLVTRQRDLAGHGASAVHPFSA